MASIRERVAELEEHCLSNNAQARRDKHLTYLLRKENWKFFRVLTTRETVSRIEGLIRFRLPTRFPQSYINVIPSAAKPFVAVLPYMGNSVLYFWAPREMELWVRTLDGVIDVNAS